MKKPPIRRVLFTLAAIVGATVAIPASAADSSGGVFQVKAQSVSDSTITATVGMGVSQSLPGGGDIEQTPEEAAAEWKQNCGLPYSRYKWENVTALGGEFISISGEDSAFSTDGCSWTLRGGGSNFQAGELATNGTMLFTGNSMTSTASQTIPHTYSSNSGVSWKRSSGSYNKGWKIAEASPDSFFSVRKAGTIDGPTNRDLDEWTIGEFPIVSGDVAPNPKAVGTFYNPLILASSSNEKILVVGESDSNMGGAIRAPDGSLITVAESGRATPGIHVLKGNVWTKSVLQGQWGSIDWIDGEFFAVSKSGGKIARSTDGSTWTVEDSNIGAGFTKVAKSSSGEYMALKRGERPSATNDVFAKSKDGLNWIGFNLDQTNSWADIDSANGCFVAMVSFYQKSATTCK